MVSAYDSDLTPFFGGDLSQSKIFSETYLRLNISYANARVVGEYSISLSSDVKSETYFSSAGNEGNFFFYLNDG